jgi:hypothetical protein
VKDKEGKKRQDERKNEMISGRNGGGEEKGEMCVYCLVTKWHKSLTRDLGQK